MEIRRTAKLAMAVTVLLIGGLIVAWWWSRSQAPTAVGESDSLEGAAPAAGDGNATATGLAPGSTTVPAVATATGSRRTADAVIDPPHAGPRATPTQIARGAPTAAVAGTTSEAPMRGSGRVTFDAGPATGRGSLPPDAIRGVMRQHIDELRFCFEWQLTHQPELEGSVTMQFEIDAEGAVQNAEVAEDLLGDETVARCFRSVVGRMRFPPPEGGDNVLVRYPLRLSPH